MSISIDVDIDDISYELCHNRRDRVELLEELQRKGYIHESLVITVDGEVNPANFKKLNRQSNDEFNQALQILFNKGWRLTSEEEQTVINLAKKYDDGR